MVSIQVKTRIGSDGLLTLQVPTEFCEREVEALLVLESLASNGALNTPEAKGWPASFFEKTAGAWQGESLVRPTQGDYEVREEL